MFWSIHTLRWRNLLPSKLLSKSGFLPQALEVLTLSRLQALEGDWHEFESKALRKENERKDKEARRALQKEAAAKEKEKKRAPEGESADREAKRQQMAPPSAVPAKTAQAISTQ